MTAEGCAERWGEASRTGAGGAAWTRRGVQLTALASALLSGSPGLAVRPDDGATAAADSGDSADSADSAEALAAPDARLPMTLAARLEFVPRLLGYAFPQHPTALGVKQAGAITRAFLRWSCGEHITIDGGVLARVPFAYDLGDESAAFPILAITLAPVAARAGPPVLLRLGSLDVEHGYHRAILDDWRYGYARPYETTYNRSIVPAARRDLGGDRYLPAEQGAQLVALVGPVRAEGYLDWQLLETSVHREKFAVGVLAALEQPSFRVDLQFRVVHYGGQIYTRSDPIRAAGLDPVRQPATGVASLRLRPLVVGPAALELPFAFIIGRAAQQPGAAPEVQSGFEPGADLRLFDHLTAGYRLWLPVSRPYGFVGEDGDPIYAGRRSQRAIVGGRMRFGPATLGGQLDLVFARDASQVEYEFLTTLAFSFEQSILRTP